MFAVRPIPRGEQVIEYVGRTLSIEEEYTSKSRYLFEVTKTKTIDGSARSNTARYINHSCDPNCRISVRDGRIFVVAKRGIKPDEEFSYDYEKDYFDHYIQPRGCRCLKCQPAC